MNIGSLEILLGVNTAGLSRAAVNMRRFESQVLGSNARMQNSFNQLGSKMMLTGTLLTQYFTVPLSLLASVSVKTFASFEAELAKMGALTSFQTDQIKTMANEILSLTSKVGKSPKELAQGLYFIGSSGIKDSALAMDILTKSANAARIGLGETKTVADAVTSVLNAYGKENITAGRATDILVAAVREGKGEADALTRVIGHVLPLAVQLGVSFDQVAGSLATLTLSGKSASEASTQIARLFTTLIQAPPRAEEALGKFGISFKKLREVLRDKGMVEFMVTLKEMIGGNTLDIIENSKAYEENITVLGDVFQNIRALLPVLDMMGPNFENLKRVLDATNNSANSLADGVNKVSGPVTDKWNRGVGLMQSSLIKFGDVLKGPIISLIQKFAGFISELANKFAALPAAQQQNIIMFAALAAAAGPLSTVFGQLVSLATSFITILTGTSIFSVITQFLLLAAAVYYLYKNWDMFVQAIKDFSWDNFQKGLMETLFKIVSASPEKVQKEWEEYAKTLENTAQLANTFPKDMGFSNVVDMQKEIIAKQKEYNSLIDQMSKATDAKQLYEAYGKVAPILNRIYQLKVAIMEADQQVNTGKFMDKKEVKRIEELKKNADDMRLKLYLAATDIVNAFEKSKSGLVSFGDLGKKILSDVGEDFKSLGSTIVKTLTGIDLKKLTEIQSGLGLSNIPDRNRIVDKPMLRRDQIDQLPGFQNTVNSMGMISEMLSQMAAGATEYQKSFDIAFLGVEDDLKANARAAELLGKSYDKSAKDVTILQNILEQVAQPELLAMMTPEQLNTVRQYLQMLDDLKEKQSTTIEQLGAWRNLFRDIASLANLIGKYMGEGFQEVFQIISDIVSGVGTFIRIIKDILTLTKLIGVTDSTQKDKDTASTLANTGAIAANTTAKGVNVSTTTGQIVANTALSASMAGLAASSAIAAAAWVPFPGNITAMTAAAAAVLTTLGTTIPAAMALGATGLAEGGQIPAGFPNDSFPAMLSSGETVIPLKRLQEFKGNGQEITVKVEGVTKGSDIHYIVKEIERRYKNSN